MNADRLLLVGACLVTLGGLPANGQAAQTVAGAGDQSRAGRAAGAPQGALPAGRIAPPPGRRGAPGPLAVQQREIQQTVARVVRNRLSLNDDQMAKIRAIDMRYAPRRIALEREEVRIRNVLANAMANPGRGGNDARITMLLDSLRLGLLQGRLEVERGEQRELGAVLAPRQLAQYFFIREQVRQTLESQAAPLPPDSAASGRARRGG
jgi:hypothetical protein